ncbi:MAG: efflux RND transporter permease subunit [Bacteroidaceae bacterium]|nr:efflux RND transporter permease subunit [Bacteroidaceae bacterium]
MNYSKWALDNRNLINFLVFCLLLGGVFAYDSMSKLEDPEIKVRQAMVVTTYPGASAHQVELQVTDPLEKSIREMAALDNVQSLSYADLSLITVELKTTTSPKDIEQEWDMLRRKVDNVQAVLPPEASTSVVKDDFGDVYGMFYAMTGDGLDDRQLSDYAELMKREISDIEGVTRVSIYGRRNECINIELLEDKMSNLGVMPTEVLMTIRNQNKTSYAGYYNNGNRRIRVTVSDKFNNVDDIRNMVIQGHEEDQLRLKDIAKVYETYESVTRNEMAYDGNRALGISIACSSRFDIVKVGKKVEKKVAELEKRMPAGVECHKVFFQPERVNSAISTFLINLLESVLIVIVVLIFFMGLKSGIIIGASLVVIVFGSFLVLKGFDGTLQRVSLASFILAMGMLVDNAIVIVDGVLVDQKMGKPRLEALTSIGAKTAMPLLGATLIAILAFLPIFLSPDTAGVYVRDLFIVIAVSLFLSWVLALVHVPIMADNWLLPKSYKGGDAQAADGNGGISDLYKGVAYDVLQKVMNFGLSHRVTMVVLAVVMLAVSAVSYKFIDQAFFPDMEYDQLYMEYKLPEGNNYKQTEKDLMAIQKYLRQKDYIKHITASVGGAPSRYNLVRSIPTPSLAYGELIIDFESPSALVDHIDELQSEIDRIYPDAYVKFKRYNLMYKKYPIEACFHGPDPAVLHQLTDSAMAIVRRSDKVYLPTSDWEPKVPVLSVDYNQQMARAQGLSRSDVAMSMMTYTSGIPIGNFFDGIYPENIYIKCTDPQGNDVSRLSGVELFSTMPNIGQFMNRSTIMQLMAGNITKADIIQSITKTTPLLQVANDVDIVWEEPVVCRYNGQRTQRLQCSPRPGVGTEVARKAIAKEIEKIQLPEGYTLSWEGEKKASDQSMKYLFNAFPMAVFLMILILILLFKDFKKPTIIFCCIPLILVGVIPSVLVTGKPFGFVAIVGVLGLIGMMIKNGIVLMDEINLEIAQGVAPRTALIQSSKSRLRPVMMASLTTILGMIPLVPDAMFGSLAVTIMGGLFAGTLITLIFIPVLYALFFKVK